MNTPDYKSFALAILSEWPDTPCFDGFELQELGVKHGLLIPEVRFAPCDDSGGCNCADCVYPDEWVEGHTCYRLHNQ